MAKIIDIKTRKEIRKRVVNSPYLNEVSKANMENYLKKERSNIQNTQISIEREISYYLEKNAHENPTQKSLMLKMHQNPALIIRDSLKTYLYQQYMRKGIYFDFKYITQDYWNIYGEVYLFWDKDYTKWYNRLIRKIKLNQIKITLLLIAVGLGILFWIKG